MTKVELLKEAKPILFNTDMVRAILDGRKTQTRRVIKPQPKMILCYAFAGYGCGKWGYPDKNVHQYWGDKYKRTVELTPEDEKRKWTPPYHTDDILYVRETWYKCSLRGLERCFYKADDNVGYFIPYWNPSIHMPKEAARIFLEVTNVRVERLCDITDDGALHEGAEGVRCDHAGLGPYGCTDCMNTGWLEPPTVEFMYIWDSTIKKSNMELYGWDANPWVWVIEFERIVPDDNESMEVLINDR